MEVTEQFSRKIKERQQKVVKINKNYCKVNKIYK